MDDKTEQEYLSLAENWLARHLDNQGLARTPEAIRQALLDQAGHYRIDYWRRVRRALVVRLNLQGHHQAARLLETTRNPLPAGGRKPKRPRCRKVTLEDHQRIMADAVDRGDQEMAAALVIARHTGARPAEMPHIRYQVRDNWIVMQIFSAKKDEQGLRGLDRVIRVAHDEDLEWALGVIPGVNMERVQDRLWCRVRALWPRRKVHISLYSYRHQLGSNLKAGNLDRRAIAAILGHRSQESATVYGNAKSGGSPLHPALPAPSRRTYEGVSPKPPKAVARAAGGAKPSRRRSPVPKGPGVG